MSRPSFNSPDDMLQKFNDYMQHCKENQKFANIAGLCVFIGIHRETYYEYKNNKPEYSNTIKNIEAALEDSTLNAKDTIKSIFYLKNKFGYADKQEIQQTNTNIDVAADDDFLDTIRKKYLSSST